MLGRDDSAGLEVVATAFADADPDHADWIYTAVDDVFVLCTDEPDAALPECEALKKNAAEATRRGAERLAGALTALAPVD